MILRATEQSIQGLLQSAIDDNVGSPGTIPVIISDSSETKSQMPYVEIQCVTSEEVISPGSGIFKVAGSLVLKSHTKETNPDERQTVLDSINNFSYDSTAAKLSGVENFHCYGWHPTAGEMTTDNETKATIYTMKYWVYCMAMNNE